MKFNEATYWPSSEPKPYLDYTLRMIEEPCFVELCKWVEKELHKAPVLLYCL